MLHVYPEMNFRGHLRNLRYIFTPILRDFENQIGPRGSICHPAHLVYTLQISHTFSRPFPYFSGTVQIHLGPWARAPGPGAVDRLTVLALSFKPQESICYPIQRIMDSLFLCTLQCTSFLYVMIFIERCNRQLKRLKEKTYTNCGKRHCRLYALPYCGSLCAR